MLVTSGAKVSPAALAVASTPLKAIPMPTETSESRENREIRFAANRSRLIPVRNAQTGLKRGRRYHGARG